MNHKRPDEYFTISEANCFTFYRVPKMLFVDDKYKAVPTDSKCCTVYCLIVCPCPQKMVGLINMAELINSTIKQAQELLYFGNDKIIRLFKELDDVNFIEGKRQGQGKTNKIYLKKKIKN